MEKYYHGENGITFCLFSELNTEDKLINFLRNVKWKQRPDLNNLSDFQVHLFPSFGRKVGLGEPDVIVACNKYLFIIEIETDSIDKLSKTFFNQLKNFMILGKYILETDSIDKLSKTFFNQLKNFMILGKYILESDRKKIVGNSLIVNDKKVKGRFRTRKFIKDLLKYNFEGVLYIVITNDHANKYPNLDQLFAKITNSIKNGKIINNVESEDSNKLGWIGLHSISRLKTISETKRVIRFNLKH